VTKDNPAVTGLIPSFARRGRGGFDYFSKTTPTSPLRVVDLQRGGFLHP